MLIEAIKRQFENAFSVLEGAIPSFTPEQWRSGRPPYVGPARTTAHLLQCGECYTHGDRSVFMNLGKRVSEMTDGDLPSQEKMLEYLSEVRSKTLQWADSIGDAGLDKPLAEDQPIALERLVYAMRHFQHHAGEVCAFQKQFGMEPAPWK